MKSTIFLCAPLAALLASPAFAHMSIMPKEATAGHYVRLSFGVGHGCDGQATQKVTITIPDGVMMVKPQPKQGWTVETVKAPYAKPVVSHGKTISEGVKTITWTGTLADEHFDEFAFQAQIDKATAAGPLYFPSEQSCAKGGHRWVEIPAKDAKERPASPAPVLMVKAAEAVQMQQHAATTAEAKAGHVSIVQPWARATPHGAKVAGGFMQLINGGKDDDKLIQVSSPAIKRVELHEMAMKDGVMVMREVKGGLSIPAGKTMELKPGGYHIMFMDLEAALKDGEKVPLKLTFEKGGAVEFMMPVRAMTAQPAAEQHKH